MQIHDIHIFAQKRRKRIGRGGKRGTYSGRGNKGQKARSGAHVNPLFEGGRSSLIERLKKVRGFKSPHQKRPFVKLSDIAQRFSVGETVSLKALIEKNLVSLEESLLGVKVIGSIAADLQVSFDPELSMSEGVRKFIEENASNGKNVRVEKKES